MLNYTVTYMGHRSYKYYLTDLAQKLLSLHIFSYLCAHLAISAEIAKCAQR